MLQGDVTVHIYSVGLVSVGIMRHLKSLWKIKAHMFLDILI